MTEKQQKIINGISREITQALNSCEHSRHEQGGDVDRIEAEIKSYLKRYEILKNVRDTLEVEFTTIHYDPR